ncbi:unnamed protein product [Penicillium salamii]|nr:unnamed protein product [Penicillium salamii]
MTCSLTAPPPPPSNFHLSTFIFQLPNPSDISNSVHYFSAKMFNTFYTLKPVITQQYSTRLQVVFRQHIQPWHPSSTLTHEAGAAVLRLAPEKFWDFSAALFKCQTEFFDISVVNETRNKTYERLAKVAASVGVDGNKLLDLLIIKETPGEDGQLNAGNQVTNDIKWMVKGAEERSISSSFTAAQWEEWLAKNVI